MAVSASACEIEHQDKTYGMTLRMSLVVRFGTTNFSTADSSLVVSDSPALGEATWRRSTVVTVVVADMTDVQGRHDGSALKEGG